MDKVEKKNANSYIVSILIAHEIISLKAAYASQEINAFNGK